MQKNNLLNKIKCCFFACVVFIETVFTGYIPANATITEKDVTVNTLSENTSAAQEAPPEEVTTEPKNAESFTGASGNFSTDISWEITADGNLTVNGKGDFLDTQGRPDWREYNSYIVTADINVEGMTTLRTLFSGCTNLISVDFRDADTSEVTEMQSMFYRCHSLKTIDFTGLNATNVTDMSSMFEGCTSLKNIDLSALNTENVNDMSHMFEACKSLETIDLSNVNVSNVTTMESMFTKCSSLQNVKLKGDKFDPAKVTNMKRMFSECTSLTKIDLSGLNTQSVTNVSKMFLDCQSLQTINLNGFNTENVTVLNDMFTNCYALQELDLRSFDTGNVEYMNHVFSQCRNLKKILIQKEKFKTENVKQMAYMFYMCFNLEYFDFSGFDTRNVNTMANMFDCCSSLTELDLSSFRTGNVTDMSGMFASCSNIKKLNLENFDTQNVTYMEKMFFDCSSLNQLNIQNFRTGKVTDMSNMFASCSNIKELDLGNFDTSNVTNMYQMFSNCESLEYLNVSNFDTRNVITMNRMFFQCLQLIELDLSSFDTTNYTNDVEFVIDAKNLKKITTGKDKRVYKISTNAKAWHDATGKRYENNTAIELEPNTTLYRLFDTYSIQYVYEGELIDCPESYELDKTLILNGYAKLPHYTFEGWYSDPKRTIKVTEIPAGTIGNITLYAKMLPYNYTITYKNIEGITNADKLLTKYTYGENITLVTPTKSCHLFEGWFLDESLSPKFVGITNTTSGNLILFAKWKEQHELNKDNGVIIKEATATSEGEIRYQCKNCSYTETEKIPRVKEEAGTGNKESAITDETILNKKDDSDIEGSDFTKFQARAYKTTKNSIYLKWNKIKDADGYKIYGNKCGKKNQYEYLKNVKGSKKTTWTHKKRKKGTYYKYIVRAYKIVDGKEVTVAVSKTIHATTTGGKKGNAKSLKIKTDKKCKKTKSGYTLTVKKGKKYTLKASEVAGKKKIDIHRKVRFESTNKKIATVSSKGVVKTKNSGTCYIYAYAQNGVYKKIKVVVK